MAAWWEMQCENAHRWSVYVHDDGEPAEEHFVCKEDSLPAVTAGRIPLADGAEIRIVPAAWEHDGHTGRTDEYFFEVHSTAHPDQFLRSRTPISWPDAMRCSEMFRSLPWPRAQRRWTNLRSLLGA